MTLFYVGTDFRCTAIADLERFEAAAPRLKNALLPTADHQIDGLVVLATCNRFEVYFETDNFDDSLDFIICTLARECNTSVSTMKKTLTVLDGNSVSEHLFSVSAGLESMIIGEEEISGQVKRALIIANEMGSSTKTLNSLFQSAASVAKSVTTHTGLGASGRSIISTALDIANERLGNLSGHRALLIGTGAYSRVVTAALHRAGVAEILVFSRAGRAQKFSESHGTTPVPSDQLLHMLSEVDLVVSASGGKTYAIDEELARLALDNRDKNRELVIVDVALSRDVERAVANLPHVFVIDLEQIQHRAPAEHLESLTAACDIIREAVTNFELQLATHAVDPVITALRSHIGMWVDEEVENVRRKAGDGAAEDVTRSLRRVTNALLHVPSVRAKEFATDGNHAEYIKAVRVLFGIEVGTYG